MRWLSPALLILLLLPRLCGQEQERKLIDRLLKPDLTLQNRAQNKEFAIKSISGNRPFRTRRFFWQHKADTKTFSDGQAFSGRPFPTDSLKKEQVTASGLLSKTVKESDLAYETPSIEICADQKSGKKVTGNDFVGNRPFLDQGKSQKALSAQKPPLTIEQVRELLNKNR